jgi:hypothetical protein
LNDELEMTRAAKIAMTLLLLGCVLFVFASPAMDLPQTTMRARRVCMLIIACAILQVCFGLLRLTSFLTPIVLVESRSPWDSLVEITCIRRC